MILLLLLTKTAGYKVLLSLNVSQPNYQKYTNSSKSQTIEETATQVRAKLPNFMLHVLCLGTLWPCTLCLGALWPCTLCLGPLWPCTLCLGALQLYPLVFQLINSHLVDILPILGIVLAIQRFTAGVVLFS